MPDRNRLIADLGETLRRYDGLAYEKAWSMPRAFYTDPDVIALEQEQLFGREWVCVGRAEVPTTEELTTKPDQDLETSNREAVR